MSHRCGHCGRTLYYDNWSETYSEEPCGCMQQFKCVHDGCDSYVYGFDCINAMIGRYHSDGHIWNSSRRGDPFVYMFCCGKHYDEHKCSKCLVGITWSSDKENNVCDKCRLK